MVRSLCRLLATLALMAAALYVPAYASAAETKPYIVLFEKSSAAGARAATADLAADEHFKAKQVYDDAVHGFAANLDAHDRAAVRDDPRVKAVIVDRPVKMTALTPAASGETVPSGVKRVGAASGGNVREASSVNVAVIDTGVQLSHPDLNAVAGKNCVGSGAPNDDNNHGTHVAGIIGAKNQGSGAVGVAPGTKIYAVKVLNSAGSGYTSQIVCGIDWVTSTRTDADSTNDIAVANMSLGGSYPMYDNCGRSVNDVEHIAVCNATAAGVTFVVAAGNSSVDERGFAPANYPEVLTVTSVSDTDGAPGGHGGACNSDKDDIYSSFSNYATRVTELVHTIAGPGGCIRSTVPNGGYATMSGTSMASPHVAGLAALCFGEAGAHGPCWGQSPANVRSILLSASATTAAADPDDVFYGGPTRSYTGSYRFYGNMASTDFPTGAGVTPAPTSQPTISGSARVGATLTAANGGWSGSGNTYTYQWLQCASASGLGGCYPISGATATTYQPVNGDGGKVLRVRVAATNGEGGAMELSNATAAVVAPVAPTVKTVPAITGTVKVGSRLTGSAGSYAGTAPLSYGVKWARCTAATGGATTCTDITGANDGTYTITSADAGKYLRYAVIVSNAVGSVTAYSYPTGAVPAAASATVTAPVNTAVPALSGTLVAGNTLTGARGTWSGTSPTFAYQWWVCSTTAFSSCSMVSGATGTSLTLSTAYRGKYVRMGVTASNGKGSATGYSYPAGPIR